MPAMPAGFVDSSWGNDVCPSFTNEAAKLVIWCDYPKPEEREFPEWLRFHVCAIDESADNNLRDLFWADDWQAIVGFVESRMSSDATRVDYASDNEAGADMALGELIRNFHATGGFQFGHNESDLRHGIASRGWYEGLHRNGRYLVLNVQKHRKA
ncbi:hypothetical protein CQ13_06450 [Bradyrhizobium retamae]|uniref:Uncharacterized protein n=2 Tax=Bradyrhizobium retamae TaxID=1300035 RepID=A0A0R3MNF6_9BRAD|nr:hypothetical protein CQ13_06450 [Bradyrhizobium retamae]